MMIPPPTRLILWHACHNRLVRYVLLPALTVLASLIIMIVQATEAHAESVQVSMNVPTTVPCSVMADGEIITPTNWGIESDLDVNASISNAAITGIPSNLTLTVRKTNSAATSENTDDNIMFTFANDKTTIGGADANLLESRTCTFISWEFSKLDAEQNAGLLASSIEKPVELCTVSLTFSAEPEAFAVYSDDDKSLCFYKRAKIPTVGETFNRKTATEIYTGFEENKYTASADESYNDSANTPWSAHCFEIESVVIVDPGIKPKSTAFWFQHLSSCTSIIGLNKLDTSNSVSFQHMFYDMEAIKSLNVEGLNTSNSRSFDACFSHCSNLQTIDLDSWDFGKAKMCGWLFNKCSNLSSIRLSTRGAAEGASFTSCFLGTSIEEIDVSTFVGASPASVASMFSECSLLKNVSGIERWDTTHITTTKDMFNQCKKLQTVDFSQFLGDSLEDAQSMFYHCEAIETINVPKLITSSTTNIHCIFDGCWSAKISGYENWDVSTVKSASQIFYGCRSMKRIDLSNWELTPNGNTQAMFAKCYNLEELDLSGINMSLATSQLDMFRSCYNLHKVTFGNDWKWIGTNGYLPSPSSDHIDGADGNWYNDITGTGYNPADIPSGVSATYVAVDPKIAFAVYSDIDKSLEFYKRMSMPNIGEEFNGKTVKAIYTNFEDKTYQVTEKGSNGNNWDADATINTPWFEHRKDITKVNVVDSGIKPVAMQCWFQGLEKCEEFDVSELDVSRATLFANCFANCSNAILIDISKWSSKPTDMTQLFYQCASVSSLDISGFDGTQNKSLNSTFHGCTILTDIKYGDKWITSSVENFSCTFFGTAFTKLDVSNWCTSSGYIFSGTFGGMKNLQELDMRNWTNTGCGGNTEWWNLTAFVGDSKLRIVSCGAGWDWARTNCSLPAINSTNVTGADGKWYAASDGAGYDPTKVPSGKSDTYYAVAPSVFAVFSNDDGSLNFYNRAGRPQTGDTWQDETVTEVYTGFDTNIYDHDRTVPVTSGLDNSCNTPWYDIRNKIQNIKAIDEFSTKSISHWFANCLYVQNIDIAKISTDKNVDCSWAFINCKSLQNITFHNLAPSSMQDMFYYCASLNKIDFTIDPKNCTNAFSCFMCCRHLSSIKNIENWDTSNITEFRDMLVECETLIADLSKWNVSNSNSGNSIPHNYKDFSEDSPHVILPKAWQSTAFAVYSADDGSLNFYNRERAQKPSAGDTFLGKVATNVYNGFDTTKYVVTKDYGDAAKDNVTLNTPWYDQRNDILSVTVIDSGIQPASMKFWFQNLTACRSFSLSKLDVSKCTDMNNLFANCYSMTSCDVSGWDTRNVSNLTHAFIRCRSMKIIDLSSWKTPILTSIHQMFGGCTSLESIHFGDGWNTSNVIYWALVFNGDEKLTLDCSNWDTSSMPKTEAPENYEPSWNYCFSENAPGVKQPKSWSADTAAASDDDMQAVVTSHVADSRSVNNASSTSKGDENQSSNEQTIRKDEQRAEPESNAESSSEQTNDRNSSTRKNNNNKPFGDNSTQATNGRTGSSRTSSLPVENAVTSETEVMHSQQRSIE